MSSSRPRSFTQPDTCIFISDLHLCASRPEITRSFLDFLSHTAIHTQYLYILGDLFEYWAGDDDMKDPFHQQIIHALNALASSGVQVFLMHGNRDFLITNDFCRASGVTLINDPTVINLYGRKVLLSHGDSLCTDDIDYQKFRVQVRNEQWKTQFLKQPLAQRKEQIEAIRLQSELEKSTKSTAIMDVNNEAVHAMLKDYHYPDLLIHGHTHRPKQHQVNLNGKSIIRWVLGDWYEQGSYLVCDSNGCRNAALQMNSD